MWIWHPCSIYCPYFQSKNAISLKICWNSFKHRLNTCHNSCSKTSINCRAIKAAGLNWQWKKLAQTNGSNKNVICLGGFGELPWSGTTHKQISYTVSICNESATDIDWNERFINVIASFYSDHWSESEMYKKKKKIHYISSVWKHISLNLITASYTITASIDFDSLSLWKETPWGRFVWGRAMSTFFFS